MDRKINVPCPHCGKINRHDVLNDYEDTSRATCPKCLESYLLLERVLVEYATVPVASLKWERSVRCGREEDPDN